jgi:hypothetical protein
MRRGQRERKNSYAGIAPPPLAVEIGRAYAETMDLQSIATQAITDLGTYTTAAGAVVADQTKLSTDQQTAQTAATTAQASTQAAIAAFTQALAELPAVLPAVTPAA